MNFVYLFIPPPPFLFRLPFSFLNLDPNQWKRTTPEAPTDPQQEARRLQTPPLRESTYDGRPRSFFFDIAAPGIDGGGSSGDLERGRQRARDFSNSNSYGSGYRQNGPRSRAPPAGPIGWEPRTATREAGSQTGTGSGSWSGSTPQRRAYHLAGRNTQAQQKQQQPTEWWEVSVPMPVPDYEDMVAPSAFAFSFDLPEHLPTSPMCPANKRHRSGGTGVCVYHGRRKRSPEPSSPSTAASPATSPATD